LRPDAFLVGLRTPDCHQEAFGRLLEVLYVERHQLGAPEGTGEAKQDDGAVAERAQRRPRCAHGNDHVRRGGSLAHGGRADRAPDARKHRLDLLVVRGRVIAGGAVEIPDCSEASPERARPLPGGRLVGQEAAQRRSGGW
jgi:hypothetical protein